MTPKLSFAAGLAVALAAAGCATAPGPLRPAAPADASAPAVLWRDPGRIGTRDLFWGAGSAANAPRGPFTFVEEDLAGHNPKVSVRDAQGREWDVKFGEEVHAEVAANRIVWALGYFVEPQYHVPSGTIRGVKKLARAAEHVAPDGRFRRARFRFRDPAMPRTEEEWTLARSPFAGTKEMSGLHVLMTLLNNWDIEGPRNNRVVRARGPRGRVERRFLVSDLGATFGRMGGGMITNRSKWNLAHFRAEKFIDRVEHGSIRLAYDGFDPDIDRVPIEHARWFAGLAGQLRPAQLRRAFEAAGAAPAEIDGFSARLLEKIRALRAAVAPARVATRRP
ncbi:MAG TPA: hypothetical protein VFK57_08240 [Vicinamibacterales bacterium]|nr:hypothetical protein [Vicinamibacterales bacterium]